MTQMGVRKGAAETRQAPRPRKAGRVARILTNSQLQTRAAGSALGGEGSADGRFPATMAECD